MKVQIDQDELCESCRMNRNRCEGSGCSEARENYMADHGLVDVSSCFGDLDVGDTVYRICSSSLKFESLEIIEVIKTKICSNIICKYPYKEAALTFNYITKAKSDSYADKGVLLLTPSKNAALAAYKKFMTDTMLFMANELAKI